MSECAKRARAVRLVCFGDSVTQGVPHCAPADTFVSLLERRLNVRYAPWEITATNAGVGGENTGEGLARMQQDVLDRKPDLVTVEFGLNDIRYEPEKQVSEAQFEENLKLMYRQITAAGAGVVLMTPNPIVNVNHPYSQGISFYDRWGGCDGLNVVYAGIIRRVAAELQCPLADIYGVFLQEAVKAEFRGETFDYRDLSVLARYISSRDGVHPTAAGQELIAAELYRVIVSSDLLAAGA